MAPFDVLRLDDRLLRAHQAIRREAFAELQPERVECAGNDFVVVDDHPGKALGSAKLQASAQPGQARHHRSLAQRIPCRAVCEGRRSHTIEPIGSGVALERFERRPMGGREAIPGPIRSNRRTPRRCATARGPRRERHSTPRARKLPISRRPRRRGPRVTLRAFARRPPRARRGGESCAAPCRSPADRGLRTKR